MKIGDDTSIGIRDLKAHLSACLKRVQAGERLTVTDRGRAIAVLAPIDESPRVEWAHAMVADGQARWDGGRPSGLARRITSRGTLTSRMVLEDRR
jgi:prevent-host-death family protein